MFEISFLQPGGVIVPLNSESIPVGEVGPLPWLGGLVPVVWWMGWILSVKCNAIFDGMF